MSRTSLEIERLHAARDDAYAYADYFELGSVARALKFVTAKTREIGLLVEALTLGGPGGESLRNNLAVARQEKKDAEQFIHRKRATANQTVYVDTTGYRR
jgi:hypothetical protein